MEDNRLTREVEATLPQEPMSLPEVVTITHRLGNYTVMTHNGMFRIKGSDADSLKKLLKYLRKIATEARLSKIPYGKH